MTSPTHISPAAAQTLAEDFARQYERLQNTVFQNMERKVCGCDYGGTSWTTREEADRISELLNLAPSRRLLVRRGRWKRELFVATLVIQEATD